MKNMTREQYLALSYCIETIEREQKRLDGALDRLRTVLANIWNDNIEKIDLPEETEEEQYQREENEAFRNVGK